MITIKCDVKNKIKRLETEGLPYLLGGLKRSFTGKNEIIDIYVLYIKNKLSKLPEEVRRERIKSLGGYLEVKVLYPADAVCYNEFIEFAKNKGVLNDSQVEIIMKQCVPFVALLNKHIVGVSCLALNEYPLKELEFNFVLGKDHVYRFKSFVDEKYRRKGIMSLLWDSEAAFAMDKGYKCIVAAIRPWNKASYIPTLKMGFEKYATAILTEHFFIRQQKFVKVHNSDKTLLSLRLFSGKIINI